MVEINAQAAKLNEVLREHAPAVYELLSEKGRAEFFPHEGILGQTKEAREHIASLDIDEQKDAINATIGEGLGDDGKPMTISSMIDPRFGTGSIRYSPSYGNKELRELWKQVTRRKNPSLNAELTTPVVTVGLTHGLGLTGHLFVDYGESIILPDLFWGNYKKIFMHANLLTFPAFTEDGRFNTSGLEAKLNEEGRKKVVLLSSPNNPTGYTYTTEEADELARIFREAAENDKNILVICDDAYFGLVYREGIFCESLAAKLADLHERVTVAKVDGITKEMFAWGERVAFIAYGNRLMNEGVARVLEDKTAGAVRGSVSNACTHSQMNALETLKSGSYRVEHESHYATLKARHDMVVKTLTAHPEYEDAFTALPFNSGYFMCVRLNNIISADEVRKYALKEHNTGTISLPSNIIRIAYSGVPTQLIPQLFDNLYDSCLTVGNKQH